MNGDLVRMTRDERRALRAYCVSRLPHHEERESAEATIAAIDQHEAEEREQQRLEELKRAEARRALTGPARMISDFRAAEQDRQARERITPQYVASQLKKTVVVLLASVGGMIVFAAAGLYDLVLIAPLFVLGGLYLWERRATR